MISSQFGGPVQNKMVPTPQSINSGRSLNVIIEGPEPSQDLSYKWVQKSEHIPLIEQGIRIQDFVKQS